ncbi:MAG: hypothetical protein JO301_14265, partial [Chitinophagaceae bacterium]|nr:hypothetical protein [Chitinophagaceae bacterium]
MTFELSYRYCFLTLTQLLQMNDKTQKINDQAFKWIGIPVTGVLAFHLSGFARAVAVTVDARLINYFFFSLISFCLWNGSAMAHYLARNQLYQVKQLYYRLPLRFGITILISWLLSLA